MIPYPVDAGTQDAGTHDAARLGEGRWRLLYAGRMEPLKGGLVLKLPELQPEEVDRVIVLELEAAK